MFFWLYYLTFNLSYYLFSSMGFIIDYFSESLNCINSKISKTPKKEILKTYAKVLPNVITNVSLLSVPFFYYFDMITLENRFEGVIPSLAKIILSFLSLEITFYSFHYILHNKWIYRRTHKKHHELTKPVSLGAIYCDPVELYFCNFLSMGIPPVLFGLDPYSTILYMVVNLYSTILYSHNNYEGISDFHNKHHTDFNCNYGTGMFLDKLFGTLKE